MRTSKSKNRASGSSETSLLPTSSFGMGSGNGSTGGEDVGGGGGGREGRSGGGDGGGGGGDGGDGEGGGGASQGKEAAFFGTRTPADSLRDRDRRQSAMRTPLNLAICVGGILGLAWFILPATTTPIPTSALTAPELLHLRASALATPRLPLHACHSTAEVPSLEPSGSCEQRNEQPAPKYLLGPSPRQPLHLRRASGATDDNAVR
jgi:hypothetical protein